MKRATMHTEGRDAMTVVNGSKPPAEKGMPVP